MTSGGRRHADQSLRCVLVPPVGYPAHMRRRIATRWAVVAFVLIGVLVALVLIVRDLGDDSDVPEDGTMPAQTQ